MRPPPSYTSVARVNAHRGVTVRAYLIMQATTNGQVPGLRLFLCKNLPGMNTRSVNAGRINITPAVALSAASIKIRIKPLASVIIVGKMKSTVAPTDRTLIRKIPLGIPTRHILKRTRMIVGPVTHRFFSLFLNPVYHTNQKI